MELAICLGITVFILVYRGTVNADDMYNENKEFINLLKEKDFDFYAQAKYGSDVDADAIFLKRLKTTGITLILVLGFVLFMFSWINLIVGALIVGVVYKSDYTNLKSYYKRNLIKIDQLLPYYLKSIEVLAQHYTIPVAISRSINTAPDVFQEGLKELITRIDSGDSTIEPYLDFARKYPVRDSMRMMRLLYRLSIGSQENKQEQLLVFSKSVSSLQNKAREKMYAGRLKKMENKTLVMLLVTGGGTMVVIVLAMALTVFGSG